MNVADAVGEIIKDTRDVIIKLTTLEQCFRGVMEMEHGGRLPMDSELLNCPFCGGEAKPCIMDDDIGVVIRCVGCGSSSDFYFKPNLDLNKEAAIAAWNRHELPKGGIIKCSGNQHCNLLKAYEDEIKELKKGGWIACSERLPEKTVLVYQSNFKEFIPAKHDGECWRSTSFLDRGRIIKNVSHWRELPEPPEVK